MTHYFDFTGIIISVLFQLPELAVATVLNQQIVFIEKDHPGSIGHYNNRSSPKPPAGFEIRQIKFFHPSKIEKALKAVVLSEKQ